MRTHKDNAANGWNVDSNAATAVDAIAADAVRAAIRKEVNRSVAADNRLIADAADRAVRIALASFGIVV